MNNVDKLMAAGVIPQNNTLTPQDKDLINCLTQVEVDAIISMKSKLTRDFVKRNVCDAANCFL